MGNDDVGAGVTVVVVSCGTLGLLRRCLGSVMNSSHAAKDGGVPSGGGPSGGGPSGGVPSGGVPSGGGPSGGGPRVVVVDNGSEDGSRRWLRRQRREQHAAPRPGHARTGMDGGLPSRLEVIFNKRNLYHGPGMDQGIRACETRLVMVLDSDCEILDGAVFGLMAERVLDGVYAVGMVMQVDHYGRMVGLGPERRALADGGLSLPYVHPHAMMLDRDMYMEMRPFVHHGAPCIENMVDAMGRGLVLEDFAVGDYVRHRRRGTRETHGEVWFERERRVEW